jgi:hypothetical protein
LHHRIARQDDAVVGPGGVGTQTRDGRMRSVLRDGSIQRTWRSLSLPGLHKPAKLMELLLRADIVAGMPADEGDAACLASSSSGR